MTQQEQQARERALRGMRVLRKAAYLSQDGWCPDPDAPSDDEREIFAAGKWGEAFRKVCTAAWRVNWLLEGDEDYFEAEKAVRALEKEAEKARLEVFRARRKA